MVWNNYIELFDDHPIKINLVITFWCIFRESEDTFHEFLCKKWSATQKLRFWPYKVIFWVEGVRARWLQYKMRFFFVLWWSLYLMNLTFWAWGPTFTFFLFHFTLWKITLLSFWHHYLHIYHLMIENSLHFEIKITSCNKNHSL